MLGLDSYGSDAESDTSDTPKVALMPSKPAFSKPASSLSALLPPTKKSGSSIALPPPTSGGLNLPPPKGAKSKRRDGPIKITVEALKPADDDVEEPQSKKRRVDAGSEKRAGAGASLLLGMLPAPKKVATKLEPPLPKALGAGAGGNDSGVFSDAPAPAASVEDDDPNLSFLPPHLRKPRTQPAPSIGRLGSKSGTPQVSAPLPVPLPPPPKEEDDAADFFGLGPKSSATPSMSSTTTTGTFRSSLSAAPQVKEYEPPPPTAFDPYPGYYQMPSGQWAAYDPVYYKQYWASLQTDGSAAGNKSGRDGKGWEGADSDDMTSVDAAEELKKAQHAELERRKGLTAPPTIVPLAAPLNIPQKAGGAGRSRHQLSTLLTDAYSNRAAIEEKLAEGRRNRKEAGNKYGF